MDPATLGRSRSGAALICGEDGRHVDHSPTRRLDRVPGRHRVELAPSVRTGLEVLRVASRQRQRFVGLCEITLHQVRVVQPEHRVKGLALDRAELLLLGSPGGSGVRSLVRSRQLVPLTELHVDVRRHVQCVRSVGREERIDVRGLETDDGPGRLVEGVNDVVNGAGMVAVLAKDTKADRACLQVDASALLSTPCGAHQRERVKRRRLIIVRKPFRQHAHRARVSLRPLLAVALAVQHFDRIQVSPLTLGRRLGETLRASGGELDEGLAGRRHVLPHRIMVPAGVAQRFAPICEREARVRLLGLAKPVRGVFPFEAVKELHAFDEIGLGCRRARVRKVDCAERGVLARGRGRRQPANSEGSAPTTRRSATAN